MRRVVPLLLLALSSGVHAQENLSDMPRYDRYQRIGREAPGSLVPGIVSVTWAEDGRSFTYQRGGKGYRFDVATKKAVEAETPAGGSVPGGRRRGSPARGRQFDSVDSPDGKRTAKSRDRNVVVVANGQETPITTDGGTESRVKYGVASWVYGEELDVHDAMWWSPDSTKLAFYRFDEKDVKDYYLATAQGDYQDKLYPEAYPKAGAKNPKVMLEVWDGTKTVTIDGSFGDPALGEYLYDVRWSPDGKSLLFNRTDRKQKTMQLVAADPATGACRVVAEERQPQSWAENHPTVLFLGDGHRFVWSTEKNGYVNFELRDLDGRLLNPITNNTFDALRATFYERGQQGVVRLDEKAKEVFYMASGPQNPYFQQLHVVSLDGRNDRLLTDPALGHQISLAPDGKTFVDVAQSPTTPPETRVVDRSGKVLATVAKSDRTKFDALGLKPTEIFTYLAADGKTTCYGAVQYPSDFDPAKKYPLLLSVYAGPESGSDLPLGFGAPNRLTELGFLCVKLAGRGTMGRGKAFRDAVYGKLGVAEMDDQAAGIESLFARPYVDPKRVGVYGGSYGGYSTIMLMLRFPNVFAVGCASSAVTDWRNYDSIYTERFAGLPWTNENAAGYDAGSAVKLAGGLKGHLMIYFGTADDNVHPANTFQFVDAVERAGGRYDMQAGMDRGHSGMNNTRMIEYFMRYLVVGR